MGIQAFFRYFFQDIGNVFRSFVDMIVAIGNFLNFLLNFPMRMEIIKEYEKSFSTVEWVMLLVVNIVLLVLIVAMVFGIFNF